MPPKTPKRRPYSTGSDRQILNEAAAQRVRLLWYSMTPEQQFAFARLGAFVPDWDGRRNARPLNPYQTFQAISRARQAAQLEPTPLAPEVVDLPPSPGRLTLTAVAGPDGRTLRLVPDSMYPFPCQIWAAPPQMPWRETVTKNKLLVIASCPQLPPEGVDLLTAFNTCFYGFQAGHKLFLRVCPISLSGFRGQPVPISTVVQAAGV